MGGREAPHAGPPSAGVAGAAVAEAAGATAAGSGEENIAMVLGYLLPKGWGLAGVPTLV